MKKKRCLCKGITCENRAKGGLAVDYEICQLCNHEFELLSPHIGEEAKMRDPDDPLFWPDVVKRDFQLADREDSEAVYGFLRRLYHLCLYNYEMQLCDAYEMLCTFVPQTAAAVFDYNLKERTGGRIYPALSQRIAALRKDGGTPDQLVGQPEESR